MPEPPSVEPRDDAWIPSACGICYNQCGIRAHRVDGTLVKIEGNPESPIGRERLCARGARGHPAPVRPAPSRPSAEADEPVKGIGVDPGWEAISWDEAFDLLVPRLEKIRREDPRGLFFCGTVVSLAPLMHALATFLPAFGTPNAFVSNGHHCGNAEHILARTLHASVTTNQAVSPVSAPRLPRPSGVPFLRLRRGRPVA